MGGRIYMERNGCESTIYDHGNDFGDHGVAHVLDNDRYNNRDNDLTILWLRSSTCLHIRPLTYSGYNCRMSICS